MAQHIRALVGFRSQSDQQLAATAGAVLKGLAGNQAIPNLPVELTVVEGTLDELNAAIAAQAHGGTAATAHKNNKRTELVALLRKLGHYVQDHSGNDSAVFLSSGFLAAATSR